MVEQEKLSFGFIVYSVFIHVVIVFATLFVAWLIDKLLLAPPFIVALYSIRIEIQKKYEVFHLVSVTLCMILSVFVGWVGLQLSLPINISLISNIIVGVIFAIISWKIQEVIDMKAEYATLKEKLEQEKVFNTDKCTLDELVARCKELKLNKENTELAIKFFIDKTKHSEIADELCISEQGARIKKLRLKKKLNNFNDF